MDIKAIEETLLTKEQELTAEISRHEAEARDSQPADVGDPADNATSSEGKDTALNEGALATETLFQVRDALQRIKKGTFGTCIECGRTIEQSRIEAVPWTPYCRNDQEKRDNQFSRAASVSRLDRIT